MESVLREKLFTFNGVGDPAPGLIWHDGMPFELDASVPVIAQDIVAVIAARIYRDPADLILVVDGQPLADTSLLEQPFRFQQASVESVESAFSVPRRFFGSGGSRYALSIATARRRERLPNMSDGNIYLNASEDSVAIPSCVACGIIPDSGEVFLRLDLNDDECLCHRCSYAFIRDCEAGLLGPDPVPDDTPDAQASFFADAGYKQNGVNNLRRRARKRWQNLRPYVGAAWRWPSQAKDEDDDAEDNND